MKMLVILRATRVTRCLKWALSAALAGPLSIVLHEMGHALMAMVLGYSNVRITYHSVDRIAPVDVQQGEKALTSEAGPIASLTTILFCCLVVLIRRHSIFAKASGMLAAVQYTGGLVYVVGALFGATPPADFDGARFAQYLNMSIFFPALAESLLLVGSWLFFVRLVDSSERRLALLGVVCGGLVGIGIWLTLLGPLLLP